jgi:uncharacterized protein with PQ loop repeat
VVSTRRVFSIFIGTIQCGIGGLACAFAYFIYASQSIQEMLSIASDEISLSMFLLLVFGMLSIVSGLLLVHKENGGH